jgi:hypothetical protein
MAQTGFTPILLYSTSTAAAAPSASNLTNSTLGSELAINITDGKLFYKDNLGAIQVIGWKVVPATAGGTGQTSYAIGDLLYADTTTSLAKLADIATGNALISGGVGVAPSWGKIGLTTHVTGTLPVANGGTGTATAFTTGSIVFAGASGIYSQDNANLFWDDTNNRLGLGRSPTNYTLEVAGNGWVQGATQPSIYFGNTLSDYVAAYYDVSAKIGYFSADGAGTQLAFRTAATERVRIDASGNVAIGTTSTGFNSAGLPLIIGSGSGNTGTTIFSGNASAGSIHFADGTSGNDSFRGYINYNHSTNSLQFGTDASERMRISSTGQLLAGTTAALGGAQYSFLSTGNGVGIQVGNTGAGIIVGNTSGTAAYNAALFYNNGLTSLCGNINISGTTTTYGTSSDYRLKENIAPMTGALNAVEQLKPVTYNWKINGFSGQGFIAHELQEVAPDCVTGEKDGQEMQSVDYGKLTPLLTAALQEAVAKIKSLENRLAVLESK